jgi:hypothetical protein|nr:MAG TPA: hypothetical protein [Caudoviricetes sp.]
MRNVVKNGLYLDLNFKGALHISLFEYGNDKLVVNLNSYGDRVWVDFICLYGSVDGEKEFFRIGGEIFVSNLGHNDLRKWIDICLKELDWNIDSNTVDKVVLDIFNMASGAKDFIIRDDTIDALSDQEFKVNFFYPCPEVDPEDEVYEDDEEEVIEEVIEEEDEYAGMQSPVNPDEVIQFLDYKLTKIEDGGLGCKSPFFIFTYENEEVYSKLELLVQKDDQGNPHITKADLYQRGYGSKDKTKAIAEPEDLEDFSVRKEEFEIRIMKAARIGFVTTEAFYGERLSKDLSLLIRKLLEGMEWKESLNSSTAVSKDEDDEY